MGMRQRESGTQHKMPRLLQARPGLPQLLLVLALVAVGSGLDFNRTILVDKIEQNLLFRVDTPIVDGQFAYDLLISAFRNRSALLGIDFPTQFYLVDYNLLHLTDKNLKIERKYFEAHPYQGRMISYPILGSKIYANKLPQFLTNFVSKLYAFWSHDQLQKLTQRVYLDVRIQETVPKVVFFHCQAGEDRTGDVFGAYQMTHNGWSYKEALWFDNHVLSRPILNHTRNGMNWYCWYLQNVKQYQNLHCDYEYPIPQP